MTDRAAKLRVIAEDLRKEIRAGAFPPGEKLPSERQLAERFDTTRATVRKAVALLRAEGLVVSRQGAGVIVRPHPQVRMLGAGANYRARRATGVSHYNAEAAAQGKRAAQHIRDVTDEAPAPPEMADRLGVKAGAAVVARRLFFTVEEEPTQLVDGYCARDLAAGTPISARSAGGSPSPSRTSASACRPEESDTLAVPARGPRGRLPS
ncbi:GntR family transcriptional regulator [Streptomyces sp. MP131-18]|uniref:GntR family transcriptional regulator n=1 Tax=Streptomyces sp. MP131-18 TaxID=1857892 RepID=UPI00097BDE4C|nr:GntR family transcriptional regulator [Streptomyces sp. MP131-18]ONK12709.1 putative HTH-type transcriptional regulator YurK [Streptomyces sp. MP131-18]